MDLILKTKAIHKLRPNTEWILDENDGLKFLDESIIAPTNKEIEQAIVEIEIDDAKKLKDKQKAKDSAVEKLAALGLTVDEVTALLG